jgi:hypothetical protein
MSKLKSEPPSPPPASLAARGLHDLLALFAARLVVVLDRVSAVAFSRARRPSASSKLSIWA